MRSSASASHRIDRPRSAWDGPGTMPLTPAEGVAYGAIQGVTEILPISSSAHLVLLPWLVGWEDPGLGFDVALHFGTFVAIVGFFWREWLQIATGLFTSLAEGRLARTPGAELFWKLVAASVPAAVVGLALESAAGTIFRAPPLIAATLAGFGALLWLADRTPATREGLGAGAGNRSRRLALGCDDDCRAVHGSRPSDLGPFFLPARNPRGRRRHAPQGG